MAVALGISNYETSSQVAVNLDPLQPLATSPLARAAEDLPVATNLLARVLARAELVAHEVETNRHAYKKRSVTAELDEKDTIIKSTESDAAHFCYLVGG